MFALKKIAPTAVRATRTPVMALCANQARFFSSFEAVSRGAAKLGKALEKEVKYENENYTQLEDIETFLNESGFKFSEVADDIEMTLTKQVGDKTIEVRFESRMPTPDEEQPEDEGQQEHEEEQGMSENYVDFTILITDNSGRKGLIIEATSMDTEINYNSVMTTDDVQKHVGLHRFERQMRTYAGPEFSTLDERIQSSLTEYLECFGVNEHLCAFVECMSLDKDQRLYMNWLNQLKDFTQV
jgi:complement component 1 Q subcomponent-binding protein, mitochondrial